MRTRRIVSPAGTASRLKLISVLFFAVSSACFLLDGCSTNRAQQARARKQERTYEKERVKREAEAQKVQNRYASYTTSQLLLRRQQIAASIPEWYYGTGLAGAIETWQIEHKKNEVGQIDRELLRRAESGDRRGEQGVSFIVGSDPPGARIEGDGRFWGIAPNVITYSGSVAATSTIRATPAALDWPVLGYLFPVKQINGKTTIDPSSLGVVSLVLPGTPASKMGLMKGDKVIAINGVALPEVTGSRESADGWRAFYRDQLSRAGFGSEITLRILRAGKEQELRGRTSEQVEGVYYVQEKVIHPMLFNNQVIMFDMRVKTGTPILLGRGAEDASRPKGTTSGTGFVVAEGGYILTCEHVVAKSDDIEVRDATGARHKAHVVAADAGNDLCLLKAEELETKPIPSAPPNSVSEGETIYCLGFPMEGVELENQKPVAGNGVVASLRGLRGDPRHLQVTVPINPGNSGGPILDAYGRWVAVASHKLSDFYGLAKRGQSPQGVNFAVKGTLVVPLFDSIPEVKLPVADAKEKIGLDDATRRLSGSVVFIRAQH